MAAVDHKTLNVYDGFEGPVPGPLWDQSKMEAGSAVGKAKVVRAGKQAIAVTVRPGDKFEKGRPHNADSERDELMEARGLVARQGEGFEYSFSMYFPADFPIVPVRLVVAQWKQYCPEQVEACQDNSPVLALRYIGGTLSVTQDLGGKTVVLYTRKAEYRGRWLDFRVQARFVPDASGRARVWLDGQQIVDFHGISAYPETPESGYPTVGHFYFKMGLYRNLMQRPMTVYIDEYRKRALLAGEF